MVQATSTHTPQRDELRTIPLSSIVVRDGFNPRVDVDATHVRELSASIKDRGLQVPLRVSALGDGTYALVAGESRYLAAIDAAVVEVPAVVRGTASEEDDNTRQAEELVDAVIENRLRRDLNPVEEALACQRLKSEHRYAVKEIAAKLRMTQALVKERLAILELPEDLWPQVADGSMPLRAVAPLASLAKLHPALPAVAIAMVGNDDGYGNEIQSWDDLVGDPVGAVLQAAHFNDVELPGDVYVAGRAYPLSRFTLDAKAQKKLARVAKLSGVEIDADKTTVRFDRSLTEQAVKLGAAVANRDGWDHIIVGQDVADQLAHDAIATLLKGLEAQERRRREQAKAAETQDPSAGTGGQQADAADPPPAPKSEEELKAERKAERQAREEAKRVAQAFNAELGSAVLRHLAKVKTDAAVLKILTAIDVTAGLEKIARRGARYGFPGWVREEQTAQGKTKVVYLHGGELSAKTTEFLQGAESAGEIAGRTIALLAMARLANEDDAVAQSDRTFYDVRVDRGLPWSDEVLELLDELCIERLPEHLTAERREINRQERERTERRAREQREATDRLQVLLGQDVLSEEEAKEARSLVSVVHGFYGPAHSEAIASIARARQAAVDAADAPHDPQATNAVGEVADTAPSDTTAEVDATDEEEALVARLAEAFDAEEVYESDQPEALAA